jgi:aminobutyraldehyde dehydrogenase
VGTVWINSHGATVAEMPFGGRKESGFGSDLSIYALEVCTDLKHVAIGVAE